MSKTKKELQIELNDERLQHKETQRKLNVANGTVLMQMEENDLLNKENQALEKVIDVKENHIRLAENALDRKEREVERLNKIIDKLVGV